MGVLEHRSNLGGSRLTYQLHLPLLNPEWVMDRAA